MGPMYWSGATEIDMASVLFFFFFPYNFNQGGSKKTQDLRSPDVLLSEAPDASATKNTWEAHN